MDNPKVAIIILNWNGWKDTIECLESIKKIDYDNYHVVVVDNHSSDNSLEEISKYIENNNKISVLSLDLNYGFAKGNNIGAQYAIKNFDPSYILILNNDTTVDKTFLQPLIDILEQNNTFGLAGPKILDYYSKKHWQGTAPKRISLVEVLMFFTPLNRLFINTPIIERYLVHGENPIKVYGIPGCAMLFTTSSWNQIGGFDETTFLGWEEYIIAEKLLKAGLSTFVVPNSVIYHKVGRSAKMLPSVDKTIEFLRSEGYFIKSYLKLPVFQRILIKLIRIAIYLAISVINTDYRKGFFKLAKEIIIS